MRQPVLLTFALAAAGLSAGCVVAVGNRGGYSDREVSTARTVEKPQFNALLAETLELRLGMPKEIALDGFPASLITLAATKRENAHTLEVYNVAAQERRSDATFTRWLYFVDGELVEVSTESINWRTDPARMRDWFDVDLPTTTPDESTPAVSTIPDA